MQQEKNEMQKRLFGVLQLLKAQEQLIETLEDSVEISRERAEMFQEILAYHVPGLQYSLVWKRVYLPIYGEINSPPFSKN